LSEADNFHIILVSQKVVLPAENFILESMEKRILERWRRMLFLVEFLEFVE
jgi:hypothetical protein